MILETPKWNESREQMKIYNGAKNPWILVLTEHLVVV